MHTHYHTATPEWTLAAGSAEGMPNLQVKRGREDDVKSECFESYCMWNSLSSENINSLIISYLLYFVLWTYHLKDCDVCVCIVALKHSGCLQVTVCWSATLILLAISCTIWQQNLALTSSLYRCNSMGASIPLLDYREGVTVYANFTFNSTLPKQTYHPFQNLRVCVHVCV